MFISIYFVSLKCCLSLLELAGRRRRSCASPITSQTTHTPTLRLPIYTVVQLPTIAVHLVSPNKGNISTFARSLVIGVLVPVGYYNVDDGCR